MHNARFNGVYLLCLFHKLRKKSLRIFVDGERIVTLGMQGKKDNQEKLFASFQLASVYNLMKYLKFEQKRIKKGAGQLAFKVFMRSVIRDLFLALLRHLKLTFQYGLN